MLGILEEGDRGGGGTLKHALCHGVYCWIHKNELVWNVKLQLDNYIQLNTFTLAFKLSLVAFCIPNLSDWTVACKNAQLCEVGKNLEGTLEGGAVSARQEWREAPPTKFSPNSYKWGRSQATVQLPEELKIIERQVVTPRKLKWNSFCSRDVIFMAYPFYSPDLLLPVICINNGKFSSICTLL